MLAYKAMHLRNQENIFFFYFFLVWISPFAIDFPKTPFVPLIDPPPPPQLT